MLEIIAVALAVLAGANAAGALLDRLRQRRRIVQRGAHRAQRAHADARDTWVFQWLFAHRRHRRIAHQAPDGPET